MEKLISVVMSTLNTGIDYLDASINSILQQTYSNIEFIIICDGSIEEYEYIKKTYDDPRIKLVLHESNLGLPKSLNEGIRASNGEYIARMDSDDIAIKNRLEIQMKYMESHPEIEISGMYARCFGKVTRNARSFFVKPEEIEVLSLYLPVMIHPTVMFRRSFFERGLYYNEEYLCAQDKELWTRAVTNRNMAVIRKYGLNYRIHDNQAGISKRKVQEHYSSLIRWEACKKLKGLPNEEIYNLLEILNDVKPLKGWNIYEFFDKIDVVIEASDEFDRKVMKRVIYNRIFALMIKYRIRFNILNLRYSFKFINLTNVKYVLWRTMEAVQ